MRVYQRLHQHRRQHAEATSAHKRKRANEIFLQMRADVLALLQAETAPVYVERQMIDDDIFHASLERHGVKS